MSHLEAPTGAPSAAFFRPAELRARLAEGEQASSGIVSRRAFLPSALRERLNKGGFPADFLAGDRPLSPPQTARNVLAHRPGR